MKLSEAFPSNFLKCDDLNGKSVTLTISMASLEEIGQGRDKDTKLVLSFHKTNKKLICNATNAKTISKVYGYGDDTDNWIGKRITLVPREVEFQGDQVWAIRVSLSKPSDAVLPGKELEPTPPPPPEMDENPEAENAPF